MVQRSEASPGSGFGSGLVNRIRQPTGKGHNKTKSTGIVADRFQCIDSEESEERRAKGEERSAESRLPGLGYNPGIPK